MLLGDLLSLVCGTGLDSNPQANITWKAPDESVVADSPRHSLENRPEIVRLNFTRTILSDAGMWRCDVRTESDQYIVNDAGSLIQMDPTMIGSPIQHDIELIIIGKCTLLLCMSTPIDGSRVRSKPGYSGYMAINHTSTPFTQ